VFESTVQPVSPALVTEYVIAPSPSDVAPELGVAGDSLNDNDVFDGAHVSVCVALGTVIVIALLVAAE
jgi:hypothetical protein